MDKWVKEATAVDLTLIRRSNSIDNLNSSGINHCLYRFNKCGHEQHIEIGKVRVNIFSCRQCVLDKLCMEAQTANLTIIMTDAELSKKCDVNSRVYKFDKCGHSQIIKLASVRNKTFICRTCLELKHESEATKLGLVILRDFNTEGNEITYKGFRRYQFIKCNHIKKIKLDEVRQGNAHCNICQQNKIENEAQAAGLVYLRKATNNDMPTNPKNYGYFQFKSCGHKQAISKTVVRSKITRCLICNSSTSKSKPSYIYLFKIVSPQFEWLKLGFSNNPEFRNKKYNLPLGSESILLKEVHFETGSDALKEERRIHIALKPFRLCPKLMKNYMQKSGHTECYPLSTYDSLLTELNRKGLDCKSSSTSNLQFNL